VTDEGETDVIDGVVTTGPGLLGEPQLMAAATASRKAPRRHARRVDLDELVMTLESL
jgi:hypothetical protein